jgi:hypothetical protein
MTVILPLGRNRNLIDVPNKPAARTNLGLGSTDSPTFVGLSLNSPTVFSGSGTLNLASTGTNRGLQVQSADAGLGVFINQSGISRSGQNSTGLQIDAGAATDSTILCRDSAAIARFSVSSAGNVLVGGQLQIGATDLQLHRGSANTLEQRNGTTGQVARWFKTFSSATNFEALEIDAAGNASNFDIAARIGSGGGVARGIRIGGKNAAGTFTSWLSFTTAGAATFSGIVTTNDLRSSGASRINIRAESVNGSAAFQTSNGLDVIVASGHNAPLATFNGNVNFVPVTIAIAANTNNLVRPNNCFIRVNCTGNSDLTGITSGDGALHYLMNVGSATLTLKHESASSDAANRFLMAGAADVALSANEWCVAYYDSTSARWRIRKL